MSDSVLLISPSGQNLGPHSLAVAETIAAEQDLDLVEVRPGVFKILDLGKLQYEASKKKMTKPKPIKEMKFKLNIGQADYETKVNHVRRFLGGGHSVKITIWFSGREVSRPEAGIALMERIGASVTDLGSVTINKTLQGRNMQMSVNA